MEAVAKQPQSDIVKQNRICLTMRNQTLPGSTPQSHSLWFHNTVMIRNESQTVQTCQSVRLLLEGFSSVRVSHRLPSWMWTNTPSAPCGHCVSIKVWLIQKRCTQLRQTQAPEVLRLFFRNRAFVLRCRKRPCALNAPTTKLLSALELDQLPCNKTFISVVLLPRTEIGIWGHVEF